MEIPMRKSRIRSCHGPCSGKEMMIPGETPIDKGEGKENWAALLVGWSLGVKTNKKSVNEL